MAEPLRLVVDRIDTPIGELVIVADEDGRLRAVDWANYDGRMQRLRHLHYGEGFSFRPAPRRTRLAAAIDAYFRGELSAIDHLPVATGGTDFQRVVWQALRQIPCGETLSYGALAQRIGRAKAVRAVGLANGANPIGVVVPCHRVVGSDGSLTGYGGGIERKRWLLAHEQRAGVTPELTLTA
jgi:methylated-DNA-[protein]-cysteine S-methyltransferase